MIVSEKIKEFNSKAEKLRIKEETDLIIYSLTDLTSNEEKETEIIRIRKFDDCWGYKITAIIENEDLMYKAKVHNIDELKKSIKKTIIIIDGTDFNIISKDLNLLVSIIAVSIPVKNILNKSAIENIYELE